MNRVEPETSVRSNVRFLTISQLGYIPGKMSRIAYQISILEAELSRYVGNFIRDEIRLPVQDTIYVATKQYKLSIKEVI